MPDFNQEIKDYFENKNLEFMLYPEQSIKKYKTINRFYNFIQGEVDFWSSCTSGSSRQINDYFNGIKNKLNNVERYQTQNMQQAKMEIDQVIKLVANNYFPCVFSTTPYAKFIKELYETSPAQADAACNFLFDPNKNRTMNGSMQNIDYLKGVILSFGITNPEVAATISQIEQGSLENLREEYNNSLNALDSDYNQRISDVKNNYDEFHRGIEEWKTELQQSTESYLDEKKVQYEDLKQLYEEKLRLEGPAQYWKNTSDVYERKGKGWRNWAIGSTCFFIGVFLFILILMPSTNTVLGIDFKSIKFTVIFTVIISLSVFMVNFFIKLSTSSFHLARDAYERYQLTYVYLSLLKEEGITEAERTIVLQSIFSRADTGLLKGDAGPTLPDGNTLSKLISIK
jgi:hypothetical protein